MSKENNYPQERPAKENNDFSREDCHDEKGYIN
jgi:hypothetical protein